MHLKPSDLLEIKAPNHWLLDGRSLSDKEIETYKAQADAFRNSSLYKFLSAAIERHALKIGFSEARDFEGTQFGKAMVATRDTINTLLWEMSENRPIGMK